MDTDTYNLKRHESDEINLAASFLLLLLARTSDSDRRENERPRVRAWSFSHYLTWHQIILYKFDTVISARDAHDHILNAEA